MKNLCYIFSMLLVFLSAGYAISEPKQFKEWVVNCQETNPDNADELCEAAYIADIEKNGKKVPVFRISISNLEQSESKFLIVFVPHNLNLFLPKQGQIVVGNDITHQFQWSNCIQDGCWSHSEIGDDALNKLRKARSGAVLLALSNGSMLKVNFSLMGLSAALKNL